MDRSLKPSDYNHFCRLEDGDYGAINLLTNTTLRLAPQQMADARRLLAEPCCSSSEEINPALKDLMIEGKFLVPSDLDEIEFLKRIFNISKDSMKGFSIGLITSLQCNFRCPYCYQDHRSTKMSKEVQQSVLSFLRKTLVGKAALNVAWWGGEPLLEAEMIKTFGQEMQRLCAELDVEYSSTIISNCYLLTPKNIDILANEKLKHLQVTLDGSRETHDAQRYLINGRGTFDIILKGLRSICDRLPRLPITVRVNVSNEIIASGQLELLLDELEVMKQNIALHFTPVAPSREFAGLCSSKGTSSKFINSAIDLSQRRGFSITLGRKTPGAVFCGAIPMNNWLVHPRGFVTKCTARMDSPEGSLGKLLPNGDLQLNEEAPLWTGFSPFEIDECRTCSVLPTCMGGCLKIPFEGDPVLDRCSIRSGIEHFVKDRILRASRRRALA